MKKTLLINNEPVEVNVLETSASRVSFELNGKEYSYELNQRQGSRLKINGQYVFKHGQNVVSAGRDFTIAKKTLKRAGASSAAGDNAMVSPMPGKILKIMTSVGEKVSKGDSLLVMEAMKMEHTIKANKDGVIESIACSEAEQVEGGVELVVIKEEA